MTASPCTVYHVSPVRTWAGTGTLLALAALSGAGALIPGGTPGDQSAFLLGALILLVCALLVYALVRVTRLVLTEAGVTLIQIGYTLQTDWPNVAQLLDDPGAEGLVLHEPMASRSFALLKAFRHTGILSVRLYDDKRNRLLAERRLIPIEAFGYWLDRGLRDELVGRAPSLREDEPLNG